MEPYEAIKLGYFDADADGHLTSAEQARFERYEKRMLEGEVDASVISSEEREILAEMWLGHVLTENLKRQEEQVDE